VATQDFLLRKTIYSRPPSKRSIDSWSYTAHQPTAIIQDALRDLHRGALDWLHETHPNDPPYPIHLQWAESVRVEAETKAPLVRVSCVEQTEAFNTSLGDLMVAFPRLEEHRRGVFGNPDENSVQVPGTDLYYNRDLYNLTERVPEYLFRRGLTNSSTFPLNITEIFADFRRVLIIPQEIWNETASSLGLLVLLDGKGDPEKPAPLNALACSIDARWARAKSIMTTSPHRQTAHDYTSGRSKVLVNIELESHVMENLEFVIWPFDPPKDGTLEMVRLHESWYELLSPFVPDNIRPPGSLFRGGKGQSAVERLLDVTYFSDALDFKGDQRRVFENILSVVFADGISRSGSLLNIGNSMLTQEAFRATTRPELTEAQARTMVRHGEAVPTFSKPSLLRDHETTQVTMRTMYVGYVLSASTSPFNWFCIALLLVHALLALAHTIWIIFFDRHTSNAWDSIPELVALAQKSEPPAKPILANTSAGTRSFRISRLNMWVEAEHEVVNGGKGPQGPLRMVLHEGVRGRQTSVRPENDTLYN
jgi:hypothetical protein